MTIPAVLAAVAPGCAEDSAWSCRAAAGFAPQPAVVGAATALKPGGPPAVLQVRAAPETELAAVAVRAGGRRPVRAWHLTAGPSGVARLRWNGTAGKRNAAPGAYVFRVATAEPEAPVIETAPLDVEREALFPIRGPHDLGRGPATNFGGGRGHKGQDMFADCGTPVAAAQGGRVFDSKYEGAAGNYVVVSLPGGRSEVYMHLQHPSKLKPGDRVAMGDPIGKVGDTGDADGCHLHFELWTAPGWFRGGKPVDPLPALRRWDAR